MIKLDELKTTWMNQRPNPVLDKSTFDKLISFEKSLNKENTLMTYLFAGTIYILCNVLVTFLLSDVFLMCMIAVMLLLVTSISIVLWMRSIQIDATMMQEPRVFLKAQIRKLNYNLAVTNIIMPIYISLIGLVSALYVWRLLSPFSITASVFIIAGLVVFLIFIYLFSTNKQRQKDRAIIHPQIAELETALASYED